MNTQDLIVVMKTAQLGNISAAAAQLDMQVATASAAIKRVEKHLGFQLFVRSTRSLRLSKQGETYLPICEQALALLDNGKKQVLDNDNEIDGELRLTAPSDFGRNILLPWLDELLDEYPKLALKLILNDHNLDFYRDGVDIALRYGAPEDSSFYGFKICDVPLLLCASTEYLEKQGTPKDHEELSEHQGLFFLIRGSKFDTWKLTKNEQIYKVVLKGRRTSNDADVVKRWCAQGAGISLRSAIDVADQLEQGMVQSILNDYRVECKPLWLICPSKQMINPSVRVLRDKLRVYCQALVEKAERYK